MEETGLDISNYELYDANSVKVKWKYDIGIDIMVHHVGIFYKILEYKNEIKKTVNIDSKNDELQGAEFYEISKLKKEEVSKITLIELEKLGYILK